MLAHEAALELGTGGPAARASGVRHDVRSESPRLWYGDFTPATPAAATGDVAARFQLRATELEATLTILDELLAGPVAPGRRPRRPGRPPPSDPRAWRALAVPRPASPRSTTGASLRLHLRTGSYANWPAVAHAAAGNLLPDFPLINKSFELCYACVDR